LKGKKVNILKKGLGRRPSGRAPSKQVLLRLYAEESKSIREIGEILNCSKDTVARALKAYEIKARTKVRRSGLARLDIKHWNPL